MPVRISTLALALALLASAAGPARTAPGQAAGAAARLAELERLRTRSPDNPGILFELAVARASAGDVNEAADALNAAIDRGLDPDETELKAFEARRSVPVVAKALQRAAQARQVIATSQIAFRLAEPDLIPEGLAYDPLDRAFFIGSVLKNKIVRVVPVDAREAASLATARFAQARDFSAPGDGLWSVLGMKVDSARRVLWACTYAGRAAGTDRGRAAVVRYDLRTGVLAKRYAQDNADGRHLFNDLAVTTGGDVYLTDTDANRVYRIRAATDRLEVFTASVVGPNGIALSPDDRFLYVADYLDGLVRFTLATGERRVLDHSNRVNVAGIDGLYFHAGTLVGVQNAAGTPRVVQFVLRPSLDGVESMRVLECRNPLFDIPTTGTIAGDEFYYLATSELDALDENGRLNAGHALKDVVVLRTRLTR